MELGNDGEAKPEDPGEGGQSMNMQAFIVHNSFFSQDSRFEATCGYRDHKARWEDVQTYSNGEAVGCARL